LIVLIPLGGVWKLKKCKIYIIDLIK